MLTQSAGLYHLQNTAFTTRQAHSTFKNIPKDRNTDFYTQ